MRSAFPRIAIVLLCGCGVPDPRPVEGKLSFTDVRTLVPGLAMSNAILAASGDFNGDGRADLLVLNREQRAHVVWLGRSDGMFTRHSELGGSIDVAVAADFDGDGIVDLGCAPGWNFLRGVGDGTFEPWDVQPAEGEARQLLAADLDGKRPPYLVMVEAKDTGLIHVMRPGGVPWKSRRLGTAVTAMVVGDVNGDGREDVVVGVAHEAIPPTPASQQVKVLLGVRGGELWAGDDFRTAHAPLELALVDFDGDGVRDLVIGSEDGLEARVGDPRGAFFDAGPLGCDLFGPCQLVGVADFNGGGRPDLLVRTRRPNPGPRTALGILRGTGKKAFALSVLPGMHTGSVHLADVDGDARVDIISVDQGVIVALVNRSM